MLCCQEGNINLWGSASGDSVHFLCFPFVCLSVPSVLWHSWLGGRKGIWPVKNWVVGYWHGYLSGARCRLASHSWCHCHSLSLASVKSSRYTSSEFWFYLSDTGSPGYSPGQRAVKRVCCLSVHEQNNSKKLFVDFMKFSWWLSKCCL